MQELHNECSFNKEIVGLLYSNSSKLVFCDAIRVLEERKLLSKYDKELINNILKKDSCSKKFFKKSFVTYLGNGVLYSKDPQSMETIKDQLVFEIGIYSIKNDLETEIAYKNNDQKLFSITLNQKIDKKFDLIKKGRDTYKFYLNKTLILELKENEECNVLEDINFMEQDRNPFNEKDDHPEQEFVDYDLGGIQKKEWVRQFRTAYQIIKEKNPKMYEEIYGFLDAVVPHSYVPKRQLSSSYSRSPGILYLSYTDTDEEQAEAIIHEVHHTIFNIIGGKYPLLNNNASLRYYSAYRPDSRHIRGCFLGLHAFVAVQNFYKNMAKSKKEMIYTEKFFNAYLKNEKMISVIKKYADLTKAGRMLFEDIKAKYQQDTEFFEKAKRKFPEVFRSVLKEVEDHLEKAKKENKILMY